MKKLILLLALSIVFLSGCGGDKPVDSKLEDTKQEAAETKVEEIAEEIELELTEFKFFKAAVPESWKEDPEQKHDSDYNDTVVFLDGDDKKVAEVRIWARETPTELRNAVLKAGLMHEDLKNKTLADGIEIGTAYGFKRAGNYFGGNAVELVLRDEPRKMDVGIYLAGETISDEARKFVDSIVITAEDIGHTDPPFPADGVRFEGKSGTAMLGTYNISGEYIKMDEPFWTYDVFEIRGVQAGEYFYILNRNNLHIYNLGETLAEVKVIDLGETYDQIESTNDGKVYVSRGSRPVKVFQGLEQIAEANVKNKIAMSADGAWGISFTTNMDDFKKVRFNEDFTATEESVKFAKSDGTPAQTMCSSLSLLGDKVAISGSAQDDSGHVAVIYDNNGVEIFTLKNKEGKGLGSVTGIIKGENSYMAADANMRSMEFWNKEGVHIGNVEDDALFGTRYPWFGSIKKSPDGNIYIVMSEQRPDKSANEIVVYRVKGDF